MFVKSLRPTFCFTWLALAALSVASPAQKGVSGVWAVIKVPTYGYSQADWDSGTVAAFRAKQKVGAKKFNAKWAKVFLDDGSSAFVDATEITLSATKFTPTAFKKFAASHAMPAPRKEIATIFNQIRQGNRDHISELADYPAAIPYIVRELTKPNANGEPNQLFEEALYYFGGDAKATVLDMLKNGSPCEQAAAAEVVNDNTGAVGDFNRPWHVDKISMNSEEAQPNRWSLQEDVLAAMRAKAHGIMTAEPVVQFLTAINDRASYPIYLKMTSESRPAWAINGLYGLAGLSKESDTPALQVALNRIVKSVNAMPAEDRMGSMRGVLDAIALGRPASCTAMLLDLFQKEPSDSKYIYAAAFKQRGEPATSDALVSLMQDDRVSATAVITLAQFRDPKYFPKIYEYLAVDDNLHKLVGILALGFTLSDQVVDTIAKYIHDSDVHVRTTVVEALGKIEGEKSTATLKLMKDDEDQDVRHAVKATLDERHAG